MSIFLSFFRHVEERPGPEGTERSSSHLTLSRFPASKAAHEEVRVGGVQDPLSPRRQLREDGRTRSAGDQVVRRLLNNFPLHSEEVEMLSLTHQLITILISDVMSKADGFALSHFSAFRATQLCHVLVEEVHHVGGLVEAGNFAPDDHVVSPTVARVAQSDHSSQHGLDRRARRGGIVSRQVMVVEIFL